MNLNIKIVCRNKAAYAWTISGLSDLDYFQYSFDREKKTFGFQIPFARYKLLIDRVRARFLEESGERAWREDVKFYLVNDDGSEELLHDNNQKFVIHYVVGELASKHSSNLDEVLGYIKANEGEYLVREFNTEAEKSAYIQALLDIDGWNDWSLLDVIHDASSIEAFDANYEKMRKERKNE